MAREGAMRYVNPLIDRKRAEKLYMQAKMDTEIAATLGVSVRDIKFWREVEGLPNNQGLMNWQQLKCRKCEKACKQAMGSKQRCGKDEAVMVG